MSEQKPNHICKNVNCKNGIDGKQKEYWACNDCDRLHSYREVACSPECFKEYMDQVFVSRNEVTKVEETKDEVKEDAIVENATVEEVVTTINKSKSRTKISEEAEL